MKNAFVIRQGGVPGSPESDGPGASERRRRINWRHPGAYQQIGYPSVAQMPDGTVVASYNEWNQDDRPLQFVLCNRFRSGWLRA